jgi:primase-polymerase (primpol)-like protein
LFATVSIAPKLKQVQAKSFSTFFGVVRVVDVDFENMKSQVKTATAEETAQDHCKRAITAHADAYGTKNELACACH